VLRLDQALFLRLALFLFLIWAATRLYGLVLWVFFAFTLAAAIQPLVRLLRRVMSPALSVFVAYVVLLLVLAGGLVLIWPILGQQYLYLSRFVASLPSRLGQLPGITAFLGPLASSARVAYGLAFRLVGGISELLLAVVLAVMVSLEPHLIRRVAPYLPGTGWAEALEATWERMGYWARAQLLIALTFAVLFGLWLYLLKVPSPWALAVLGGILEVMPFVGGALIALLAALVALSKGLGFVALVLLGYGLIALLEGKLLIPLIYGQSLGLHPAAVLLAIFVGGKLFGLLGIFLAVPGLILLGNLYRFWQAQLGNREERERHR
jgi:predicted PurR-regulated permease PerM